MIFEKPSLRTRVSFSAGMVQLGGSTMMLRAGRNRLGKREPVKDFARVISSMCDGIMARTFSHANIVELAKYSSVPVINGLTDYNHPCQAMADVMTVEEHFGKLGGLTMAFIGDGNNVARSLASACGRFGMRFVLASPAGYEFSGADMDQIMGVVPELDFVTTADPREAVREAEVVVTDTWVIDGAGDGKAAAARGFRRVPGGSEPDVGGAKTCGGAALSAGVSGAGDQRGRDRGAAVAGVPGGGESAALSEGIAGDFDGRCVIGSGRCVAGQLMEHGTEVFWEGGDDFFRFVFGGE